MVGVAGHQPAQLRNSGSRPPPPAKGKEFREAVEKATEIRDGVVARRLVFRRKNDRQYSRDQIGGLLPIYKKDIQAEQLHDPDRPFKILEMIMLREAVTVLDRAWNTLLATGKNRGSPRSQRKQRQMVTGPSNKLGIGKVRAGPASSLGPDQPLTVD